MRSVDAALYLARRFPGGIEAVATLLPSTDPSKPAGSSKSPHSLRHELTGTGTAKLGLEDAELLTLRAMAMRVPDPLAILNAFATNCHAMVVPLPDLAEEADASTFDGLAAASQEFADFVRSVAEAAADNQVTANELIGRTQSLRTHLAQLHERGKERQRPAKR
jgi:hypothetical protein